MSAAARLLALPRLGQGAGLHRMLWLLDHLPDPDWVRDLDAIKITGSKGKGSTCAVTAEILRQIGVSTGLYTSPHLERFNERIRVAGEPISDDDLTTAADWALDRKAQYERCYPNDRMSAFEMFTAAGLYHFCSKQVEAVVSEAGLGGRYDSTRVIPGALAALTSVELEHTRILGNTLEMIAYDKADLCPSGGSLVVGQIDAEVSRRLWAYCRLRQVEFVDAAAESVIRNVSYEGDRMHFDLACVGLEFRDLTTHLRGEHQARNIAVAIHLASRWIARHRPAARSAFEPAVRTALEKVVWPGRLERIRANPEIIIDVGHTPRSVRAAADTVRAMRPGRRVLVVTAVSADKDVAGILTELVPIADALIATSAYHRGAPADNIAREARRIKPDVVWRVEDRIENAIEAAVERATAEDMTIYIAGGLFLAIEARAAIEGRDPRALHFF